MSSTLCCYMPRFIQANPIQYCCISSSSSSSSSSSRSMHRFIGPLALTNSVLTATMLLLRRAPMLAGTVLVLRNAYSLNTASICLAVRSMRHKIAAHLCSFRAAT